MALPALTLSALALGVLLAGPAARALASQGQEKPTSLEDLGERFAYDLGQQIALVRGPVEELIASLDAYEGHPGETTRRARREELVGYGPAAVPLLLPYVDPFHPAPPEGTADQEWRVAHPGITDRAEIVAEALAGTPSVAATDGLIAVVLNGSYEGRINALRALRTTPDAARVFSVLRPFALDELEGAFDGVPNVVTKKVERTRRFGSSRVETVEIEVPLRSRLRRAAVATIAELGIPASDAFLVELLSGRDQALRDAATGALAEGDPTRTAPMILALTRGDRGWGASSAIVGFYDGHDALLGDIDHAEALLELSLDPRVPDLQRAELFDLLRETDTRIPPSTKRKIEHQFADAGTPALLRAATLQLLARRGSRSAKRELLDGFDDRIRAGRNVAAVLAERAEILHDIGEWNAAVRDWREAIDRASGSVDPAITLGYARSLARAKKYRDAEEVLQRTSLSLAQLRGLARDRDFRAMAESRYRDAFHLEDGE